jgi:hypothetical protein
MSKSRIVVRCFAFAAFAAFTAGAEAQELLRSHTWGYGFEVVRLADVDGDAVADYAVQGADNNANGQEIVEVRSGKSGALIRSIPTGAPAGEIWSFGSALADAGDVDGDGVSDLLVGAMLAPDSTGTLVEAGAAYLYSGSDGHLIRSLYGSASHEWFGTTLSGLDDVDGDGSADYLVESRQQPGGPHSFVTAFSGATGAVLFTVTDAVVPTRLSDHDHDGIRDFATLSGSAEVWSGATGALLASIPTTLGFDGGLAEIDDLDGDGEPELVFGENGSANPTDGQVRVVSIPNQTTLRTHLAVENYEMLGQQIDSGFDADGDGVHDYLVGAPAWFDPAGSASLFSGRTGERLYRFVDRDADSFMGWSVAGLGDLDGDGRDECIVGSPYHLLPGTKKFGAALVYRGNDLWLDAYPKSVAAGATETVAMHGAPSGNPVALFVVAFGGSPAFQLAALGAASSLEAFDVSGTVPVGLSGGEWTLRAYALDANGKLMVSADEVLAFN